jgi:hypothetical protein
MTEVQRGRDSMPIYRPVHSAHGGLYWRCVMWPVAFASSIRRVKLRCSACSVADAPDSRGPNEDTGHTMPLSRSRESWLFSQQGRVWFAGEGDVRPEGWTFARLHAESDSLSSGNE